ncbi:MAG TPA: trehalose-phosphatase [Solimonas sp.]|nr:trehalose-phosphatase [Solimonas sp.]
MPSSTQHRSPAPPLLALDSALFLDFDGTLAEFAPRPDSVPFDPSLPPLLAALSTLLGGALAVITGRPLAEIDVHLAPVRVAGAGLHGAEVRLGADEPVRRQAGPSLVGLIESLRSRFASDPRLLIEDKGAVVALHFRQAPERARECIEALEGLAASPELEVIAGHSVVEARPRGIDKGQALKTLTVEPPFAGRYPVFVGDDRSDEDGFALAQQRGGFGVKVGAGPSTARYRCPSVQGVHAWLQASLRAGQREAQG